jgi:hypothetical protein
MAKKSKSKKAARSTTKRTKKVASQKAKKPAKPSGKSRCQPLSNSCIVGSRSSLRRSIRFSHTVRERLDGTPAVAEGKVGAGLVVP